jgi:hypothetical protein
MGCSGSGGGNQFVGSVDIQASHPFLRGTWSGDIRSLSGQHLDVQVYVVTGNAPGHFAASAELPASPCFRVTSGIIRANGPTVVFEGSELTFTGTLNGNDRIDGTYSVVGGICRGDAGSVTIFKTSQPAHLSTSLIGIEVYEAPGWFIQIETHHTRANSLPDQSAAPVSAASSASR